MAKYISVDSSTNSFAFGIWEDGRLLEYGKLTFHGENGLTKSLDAARKVHAFLSERDIDTMIIEAAIFSNSASVALSLGVMQGSIMGAARLAGVRKVQSVAPITWQCYINNPNFTRGEKAQIRKDKPGHTTSWYRNFERGLRKQKTMDFVNKMFKIDVDDNDVGDAIAIGYWAGQTIFGLGPLKRVKNAPPVKRIPKKTVSGRPQVAKRNSKRV